MQRADEAARSVLALFGQRLWGIPFTHIGAVARPGLKHAEWHYWWQAHFIDCLVDATRRGSHLVPRSVVPRHIATLWLRNGGRFPNNYYDDMAWLALAVLRSGRSVRRLGPILTSAITDDLGGGAFWNRSHDFKNTAATGPIALVLARTGHTDQASRLVSWLRANLLDDDGLFRDGLKLGAEPPELVPSVFTYNQGPVLGAYLELGLFDEAEALVHAVATTLTHPGTAILKTHGPGDGGLFTGILARYLALAANEPRLSFEARSRARDLIDATAANLWDGRETRRWRSRTATVFPQDTHPGVGAVGDVVELSTQLQAWMTLEAAS